MKTFLIIFLFIFLLVGTSCKDKKSQTEEPEVPVTPAPTTPDISNTLGYSILNKIKGIWNGPVTSTTPLGGYPEWIVDFRPISENQVSAKNELDTLNDIHFQ